MDTGDIKRISLRRDGVCTCGAQVLAGTSAGWDRRRRVVVCPGCLAGSNDRTRVPLPRRVEAEPDLTSASPGTAGASAQVEYERRKARREQRVRAAHPRLGGFLLAVTNEPQSTRAWASGAAGERRVAERLAGLAGEDVLLLHDQRIPRSRANIDHIAVGPAGVYVIDAKCYHDAKVEIRRSGGIVRPVVEKLCVGGRDQTKLVTGLDRQVVAVRAALMNLDPTVQVTPMLCFVDALLPVFKTMQLNGVPIVGIKGAAKFVRRPGPLDAAARERVHTHLASKLGPAVRM